MHRPLPRNRYGVEIKLPTVHVECECLREVLTLLEGQSGVVRVFDRHSLELVVDGAINDVWASLDGMADSVDVRMEPAAELESSEMVARTIKSAGKWAGGVRPSIQG